ncbi:unnamed protein product [Echinostoma caproni]|uniref:Protein kinase domain-containing protein n=1 Tax=Echinostoma caproni TaxID=27848 RepID=A0A183AAL4_9TREM|nr:unnamed protein product [Echinostoma caproni]
MIASLQRSNQLEDPVYVDHMCTDELCFFFRCRTATEQTVVIKNLVIGSFRNDPRLTATLRRRYADKIAFQVSQLKRLRPHPAIVRLGICYRLFGPCSVVTEFHPEGNLFNWLANQTHLTLWSVCKVIQHICIGMDYLHRNRVFHGNLGFRDVLFKSAEPNSVAIVLDVSIRASVNKICASYVYDLDRCPPELFDSVCQIAEKWPPTSGRPYRTGREACVVEKLLQPTWERDIWCVGVMAHQLLTGVGPFTHIQLAERSAFWNCTHTTKLTHPMLSRLSRGIVDLLERLLHTNPLLRATAEDGAQSTWYNDNQTKSDKRNLLSILEHNFMNMEFSVYRDTMCTLNRLRTQ